MNSAKLWYQKEVGEIFRELQTSEGGLTTSEAESRLQFHGHNKLPEKGGTTIWTLLFRQINNPLIFVLIASALLAVLMGKITDGLVVFVVVVINALIGFIQEYRSNQEIAALKKMVPDKAVVIRDGDPLTIDSVFIVPGDIVLLQSGSKVPADIRLFEARSCMIVEAALTGESLPSQKSVETIHKDAALGDRKNMAFNGTSIASGTAKGVVVQTGESTELGKINAMLTETHTPETPLTRSISHVAKSLTFVILAVSTALFGIAYLRGYPIGDAVLAAITLAVAAIPEGIPAIITIALAIGVRRMAKGKAVIRNLPAVETLGSTTIICTDKTGTITRNEMTVVDIWTLKRRGHFTGTGYNPSGKLCIENEDRGELSDDMRCLLVAGVLCNDSHLVKRNGKWEIEGDPTEGALLTSAYKGGLQPEQIGEKYKRIDAIPFESEYKFMATLNNTDSGKSIYIKGAPETILERCELSKDEKHLIQEQTKRYGQDGKRVLAFARKMVIDDKSTVSFDDLKAGLEFLGLQVMIDPPREEVKAAIEKCHTAGITVKMLTGDHQTTAAAIGTELKIISQKGSMSGEDLEHIDNSKLTEVASDINVFARVAPEHKLKLVSALQERGEVVAVTGDGVNDAPALKKADIGVAMGITGTDVSKDAADMVLTDDNFATIVSAVEEGRRVYDNLIKSLAFALPTNLGEALILLVAVALFPIVNSIPLLPMSPVQILWINLVATVSLALPLAFESKERNIMNRPPRNPKEPLLSRFVLFRTVLVAIMITVVGILLFLLVFNRETAAGVIKSVAISKAQTMAVTSIVFLQIFYLLNCRSLRESIFQIGFFSNFSVIIGIAILLILQLGFVYLPAMNNLFGSSGLDLRAWVESFLAGAIVLPVISVEKMYRNFRSQKRKK